MLAWNFGKLYRLHAICGIVSDSETSTFHQPIFVFRKYCWLGKRGSWADQKRLMTEETAKPPTLTPEEQKLLVDEAIEKLERLAESQLDMARLFIDRGKIDIARRRLQEVVELYSKSDSAKAAKKLLKTL